MYSDLNTKMNDPIVHGREKQKKKKKNHGFGNPTKSIRDVRVRFGHKYNQIELGSTRCYKQRQGHFWDIGCQKLLFEAT